MHLADLGTLFFVAAKQRVRIVDLVEQSYIEKRIERLF
jgi:hypothetical protein